MKSNLPTKIFIAICLCIIAMLTFTACRDKEIFAESSDFESYPDYWNDFNQEGNIFVPNDDNTSANNSDASGSDIEEVWPGDINDGENNSSNKVDTDGDTIQNNKDDDIDGDGVKNEDDDDIDGDGVKNEDDNDTDGDGTDNEGDLTPEGPTNNSGVNEGPLVPLK